MAMAASSPVKTMAARIANVSLLFIVFLDVMGQGLIIPVLTTLVMDPGQTLLDSDTPASTRRLYYGLTMGVFFLSWFLGAAYISKLSDFIGRKQGILICLNGALTGYVLTIVAITISSFPLLVLARVITGFTAGNQPIAQAALVDISANDTEKTRNMGLVVVSLSLGLVMGPILGGTLSDPTILGGAASMELPFYAAAVLVAINLVLIILFFRNVNFEPRPVTIRITDVFLTLYTAAQRPVVLRLALVFFFAQLALNAFFVFVDDYLYSRFGFDTLQNSIILIVFGAGMALAGAVLVPPLAGRFSKIRIVYVALSVMAVSEVIFIVNPVAILAYVLLVPFVVAFAVYYPQLVTLFSAAVDESEQGWVMGVTVALYTLGAGIVSMIGGELMEVNIGMPLIVSVASLVLALALMAILWRGASIRRLDPTPSPGTSSNGDRAS
jgi:DHA1 family tetracycline resistance protein-like MFS transporter